MPTFVPDQTYSTLQRIQIKARRLTRRLTEAQLSTAELNNYINTFLLYDMPEHLRLFNFKTTFSFVTTPYTDVYETTSTNVNDQFYNFSNRFSVVTPPIYVAGFNAIFSESRAEFFGYYPAINSIQSIGVSGNGMVTTFSGVINSQQNNGTISGQVICLLKKNVLFSSIDSANNGVSLVDLPLTNNNVIGNLYNPNGPLPSDVIQDMTNYINYLTGEFVITFSTAPGAGQPIMSQTVPNQPSMPRVMLFFDGKITLRPVPDQPYKISMEVFKRPEELLNGTDEPQLAEWWQYIAYGAAKKVFEDLMDLESIKQILPEYHKQELLVNRRTIVQQSSQRVSTIYTPNNSGQVGFGWGYGYFGSGPF